MTAPSTATAAPTRQPAEPPDEWECSLQLTNDPRAPGIARATVRTAMRHFGLGSDASETAELLASELVTNAVKHAESPVYVRASTRDGVLRISVWDNHPELPEPLQLDAQDTFGRGLALVQHLATRWGRYPLSYTGGGKVVWFEIAL